MCVFSRTDFFGITYQIYPTLEEWNLYCVRGAKQIFGKFEKHALTKQIQIFVNKFSSLSLTFEIGTRRRIIWKKCLKYLIAERVRQTLEKNGETLAVALDFTKVCLGFPCWSSSQVEIFCYFWPDISTWFNLSYQIANIGSL